MVLLAGEVTGIFVETLLIDVGGTGATGTFIGAPLDAGILFFIMLNC